MLMRNLTTSYANYLTMASTVLVVKAYRILKQGHTESADYTGYRVLWEGDMKSGLTTCALYMEEGVVSVGPTLQV